MIYPFQVFRALRYIACLYPLIRMLRVAQWEMALAMAFFLSVWTTALLLPNSMMPASVAQTHLWETLGFSLVFGALAGWLLPPPHLAVRASAPRRLTRLCRRNLRLLGGSIADRLGHPICHKHIYLVGNLRVAV